MGDRSACEDGGEDGFATVLSAFMIAVLVAVAVAVTDVGAAVAARHQAQAAADLAALAAAALVVDADSACGAAVRIAAANRARVVDCVLEGPAGMEVVVRVEVAARFALFAPSTASAAARAGPV